MANPGDTSDPDPDTDVRACLSTGAFSSDFLDPLPPYQKHTSPLLLKLCESLRLI